MDCFEALQDPRVCGHESQELPCFVCDAGMVEGNQLAQSLEDLTSAAHYHSR